MFPSWKDLGARSTKTQPPEARHLPRVPVTRRERGSNKNRRRHPAVFQRPALPRPLHQFRVELQVDDAPAVLPPPLRCESCSPPTAETCRCPPDVSRGRSSNGCSESRLGGAARKASSQSTRRRRASFAVRRTFPRQSRTSGIPDKIH